MLEAALRASTEVIHARRYPHTASCTVADEGARAIVLAEEALRDGREGPGPGCHCFGPKARRAPPKTSLWLISSAAGSTARRRRCPGTPSSSAATPSTPASCLLQRLAATRRAHPMTLGTLHDAPSPPPLTSSSSSWRVGGTAGRGPRARWARARSPLAPSPSSRRPRGTRSTAGLRTRWKSGSDEVPRRGRVRRGASRPPEQPQPRSLPRLETTPGRP